VKTLRIRYRHRWYQHSVRNLGRCTRRSPCKLINQD